MAARSHAALAGPLRLVLLSVVVWLLAALPGCAAAKLVQPPTFDYPALLDSFFHQNPTGHFPVIIQKGMNTDPAVSENGYLFYSSDTGGSPDIWMRQLRSTVNLVIVEQAAAQTSPAVSGDGRLLAYVSYDRDPAGDIMLTAVDPDAIARDVLRGRAIPNHFASSISVSSYLERTADAQCAGAAAELDPFLSKDGRTLYFATDRCQPGRHRIWSVALGDGGRPSGRAVPLSSEAGIQPVAGQQRLVATAIGEDGRPDGFLVIPLGGGPAEHMRMDLFRAGLAMRPVLSADERSIFFLFAPRDTNGDGKVDRNDHGGVYVLSLEDRSLRSVVEDSMPVYSIALSTYLQGGILYAAYEGGRSRIFLSGSAGVIPARANAWEQYLYALGLTGRERRPVAMESVVQLHAARPEFFLFEADVYAELWKTLRDDRGAAYKLRLERALAENPYARLARDLGDTKDPLRLKTALSSPLLNDLTPERKRMALSWLRDRVAGALEAGGRSAEALVVLETLNREDPGYFNAHRTVLRELALQVALRKAIPDSIRQMLSDAKTEEAFRQQLLQTVFEQSRRGVRLNARAESHPVLRGLLLVLEGQRAFQERRYDEARDLVLEGLKSSGEQNLAHTYGWKVLTSIYDLQQKRTQALEARLRFLTSYRRDWNLEVEEADFQRLIDSSKGYIDGYRASAASIAEDVEDRQDYRLYVIGQIQTATGGERLSLRLRDRSLLAQFCDATSPAGLLIRNLGYKDYLERQAKICVKVAPYLEGKAPDLALEDAHEVSQLFYLVSYANANLINILFLQFREAGLFDELHRTWSVHYHRIKVDIAIERLKRNITWQEKQSELLKAGAVVSLFTDRDPFDAKIFEEILVGYRMGEDNARRHSDQSLLYGYAYLLIRKSEEREAFYDALPGRGVSLSGAELVRRKESVLGDLKQAEYRLQYIRSVDPGFVDATLLLSYLYQYIDARRSMPIAQETGNTERIARGLVGMRTSRPDDGVFFRVSYQKFFGSRYYERNVDLLTDALDEAKRDGRPGMEKGQALLQLNLGNNYFQLVNYRAAADAYDQAEGLARRSHEAIFDTWMQRTLFHVNRGRARFYSGEAGRAALDFAEAARLLSTEDYWPTTGAANRAYYAYRSEAASKYLRARSDRKKQALLGARYRLAFVRALQGLALQEDGNPAAAVVVYREAVGLLYGRDMVPQEAIPQAGLENYVALAFQSMEDYERSELAALSAAESARAEGLSHADERFNPQTGGGRLLGILLGYGEDFSVIGEGRTPFGFSPLRQFELSLGIRARNQMRTGDLDTAVQILSERVGLFKSKDGSRRLGREGMVYALNQKAEIAFHRGDYAGAFDLYREGAKIARKAGMLASYRLNFRNSYHVLFRQVEEGRFDSAKKMDAHLDDALDDLADFREAYRDAAKAVFIKQRVTEDPEFSFTPVRDDPVLDRIVLGEVGDFAAIEGLLHFYRHRLVASRSGDSRGSPEARAHLDRARALLERAASIDEQNPTIAGMRIRLNLARVLLALDDETAVRPVLARLEEETYEFNAIPERFELLSIQAEQALREQSGVPLAMLKLGAAMALYREHAYLLPLLMDRLPGVLRLYSELSLRQGQGLVAVSLLEELRSLRLQAEFYRFPLQLGAVSEASEAQRSLRQTRGRLRWLSDEEVRLRLAHRNPAAILREQEAELARLRADEKALVTALPRLADFVTWQSPALPGVLDAQRYIRMTKGRDGLSCVRLYRGQAHVQKAPASVSSNTQSTQDFLGGCVGDMTAASVLVADGEVAASGLLAPLLRHLRRQGPVALRTTWLDASPVYIRQRSEDQPGMALFNVSNAGPGGEANVVAISEPPGSLLFARGASGASGDRPQWSGREWLAGPHDAAVAVVSLPTPLPDGTAAGERDVQKWKVFWQGLEWAHDVFRAGGGGAILVGDAPQLASRAAPVLTGQEDPGNVLVFGFAGFSRSGLLDLLREKHAATHRRAMALLPSEPGRALRLFELADSYLRGTDEYLKAGAENRLHLGRALVSVDAEKGGEYFEGLLSEVPPAFAHRRSIYRLWLLGLASGGQWARVSEVLKRGQAEGVVSADFARMLSVLPGLERSHIAEGTPIPDGGTLRQVFTGEPELADRAGTVLYRHGELDLAAAMSHAPRNGEFRQRLEVENELFNGRPLPRLDRNTLEGDDMMLLWAAGEGLWEFYDDFLSSRSGLYSGSAWDQKSLLYHILRRRLKEGISSVDEMSCLATPSTPGGGLFNTRLFRRDRARSGKSGCDALTPTEQTLFFRMALDSLPVDSTGQVRAVLRQLVSVAHQRSSVRASRMALLVATEYVRMGMMDQAMQFLALSSSAAGGIVPSVSLAREHAFVIVWLHLHGKPVSAAQLAQALQHPYARRVLNAFRQTGLPLSPAGTVSSGRATMAHVLRQMNDSAFDSRDRLLACGVLLERARNSGDAESVLDLAIARKRLLQGRSDWMPLDRPGQRLSERLPQGQSFFAVHDTGAEFVTVRIAHGRIELLPMDRSSSVLRSRLLAYLLSRQEGTAVPGTASLLSGEYESLMPQSGPGLQYLWCTGVHQRAPVETRANVLHVLDPDALLAGPTLRLADRPGKGFRVGNVDLTAGADAEGRAFREAVRRIADWANAERSGAGPSGRAVDIREGQSQARGASEDWVLLDLAGGLSLAPGRLPVSESLPPWTGPIGGIGIAFRAPEAALPFFPLFLKSYLNVDVPTSGAFERLEYARHLLRDAEADDHLFLKLSVGSFVQ